MTDKLENSLSNIFSVQTPKQQGKSAKSFKLFFSNNHFLPKSYKSSLHYSTTNNDNFSNKFTTLSTYQKSEENNNKRPSLSFIKKLQLSTSKLENLANQYQKMLYKKINDEKSEIFQKKFEIFKEFEKFFNGNKILCEEQQSPKTENIIENDIFYFLLKLDDFFQEKSAELLEIKYVNEKFIKEAFEFVFEQIR